MGKVYPVGREVICRCPKCGTYGKVPLKSWYLVKHLWGCCGRALERV